MRNYFCVISKNQGLYKSAAHISSNNSKSTNHISLPGTDKQLLSHDAECNMANIFRVSHILQLISRAFRRVKQQQNMRNSENISQYCTISRAITTLSLRYHSILLLQPYQLVILQKFEYHQSVEKNFNDVTICYQHNSNLSISSTALLRSYLL